jgi:SAM-dependent methyltransferase
MVDAHGALEGCYRRGPVDPREARRYYDRYWGAEVTFEHPVAPELENALRASIEPGLSCLDVGCGAARTYAQWLAPTARLYAGVDVSAKAVELARQAGIDAQVIADAASLPFEDESFDAAICVEVFEHLFDPRAAAAEIRRVLAPGGRLVASVPNVAYWRLRMTAVLGQWDPGGDPLASGQPWRDPHIRFFTASSLMGMLRDAGFSRVEVGGHGGCFLDHLTSRPTNFGVSRAYRYLQRRYPSLLGLSLHAVATR